MQVLTVLKPLQADVARSINAQLGMAGMVEGEIPRQALQQDQLSKMRKAVLQERPEETLTDQKL